MNDSFDRITELCGYVLYRFVYSLVTVCICIKEKNAHARFFDKSVLINLKLLVCRSSCHQSFTHFIFICLRTLLHKTVECGHGSYVKAKKMTF